MKRYMFSNYYIDTERSWLAEPTPQPEFVLRGKLNIAARLAPRYGTDQLFEKLERYLSFTLPDFCVVTEFHQMLREVQDAYVCGHFYPALTGACCIGERIFNVLLLRLREYYKDSPSYKIVCDKASFDDWNNAIDRLLEWSVLPNEIEGSYRDLSKIRHHSIHFKDLSDLEKESKAGKALADVLKITSALFGRRDDVLFEFGHLFIKKEKENDPLVREFYIPASCRVGYKYRTENRDGKHVVIDDQPYEDQEVTDEEFVRLRQDWLASQAGAGALTVG
ncbi:MAG: hypothetical protein O7A06_01685 [Acidobacteria bacterium]|nr:hypothetical protein [Acidobacteriota bacterium]